MSGEVRADAMNGKNAHPGVMKTCGFSCFSVVLSGQWMTALRLLEHAPIGLYPAYLVAVFGVQRVLTHMCLRCRGVVETVMSHDVARCQVTCDIMVSRDTVTR